MAAVLCSSAALAGATSPATPAASPHTIAPAGEAASVTIDSVNLSAEAFFASYTSKDEAQRHRAMLYLLGVQDATEGRVWCDYRTLKTITLREFVFEYFKKLPKARMQDRASKVIEEALRLSFACKQRKNTNQRLS